jgi:hypothetical protein
MAASALGRRPAPQRPPDCPGTPAGSPALRGGWCHGDGPNGAKAVRSPRGAVATENVHILVPHKRRRSATAYVVIERTRRLPRHRSIDQSPVSPIARALVDATRLMTDLREIRALNAEVIQHQLCTVAEVGEERRAAQSRGTALPRRVLGEVAGGIRSVAEAEAREVIQRARLPKRCGTTTSTTTLDGGSADQTRSGRILGWS